MDLKLIEELLTKYYSGETSLEQEEDLIKFFSKDEVPEHLKAEQVKFKFYSVAQKEKTEREYFEKVRFEEENHGKKSKVILLKRHYQLLSGLAASIVLIIGAYFFLNKNNSIEYKQTYGTYDSPELAYAETKKALQLISEKFNKGTKDLNELSKLNEIQHLLTDKN